MKLSRDLLFYSVIFVTGLCSLVYQVIWQRYLALMLGSEARSSTLIICIFLAGLGMGYSFFGDLSKRIKNRKKLLQLYGGVELLTGLYAIIFNLYFQLLFDSSFLISQGFIWQFIMACLLILLPSFLMGATVPVMTTVMPDHLNQISTIHARIYGINTIGAFIGTLLGGPLLVFYFGMDRGLIIAGLANVIVAAIYLFNNLEGTSAKAIDQTENKIDEIRYLDSRKIVTMSFISGLSVLALEMIWMRYWTLVTGPSAFIFPFVVSVFVLGIGAGSLFIKEISQRYLKKQLFMSLFLISLSYVLFPYLPIWMSNTRVVLISHPVTFNIFIVLSYFILMIFIFPLAFSLGRILPLSYGLLDKDHQYYGRQCAFVYFLNTAGTFIGALFFGYFLLMWFDLFTLYKMVGLILLGVTVSGFKKSLSYKEMAISVIILLVLSVLPMNRSAIDSGMFRNNQISELNFQGLFNLKPFYEKDKSKIYLEDGPNVSVWVHKMPVGDLKAHSLIVNGKSDSSTLYDYPTISLLALYPYLIAPWEKMNAALVGLGTGLTAIHMGNFSRIDKLDVIEVSQEVLNAQKSISHYNGHYFNNRKINTHIVDAFTYFKGKNHQYEIIISEPPNPWVNGVENLFTDYYYKMIKKALKQDGIFTQWVQVYEFTPKLLTTILKNIQNNFQYIRVINSTTGDLGIIGSDSDVIYRSADPKISPELEVMNILSNNNLPVASLDLFDVWNESDLKYLVFTQESYDHQILHPQLSVPAYRSLFLKQSIDILNLVDSVIARRIPWKKELIAGRQNIVKEYVKAYQNQKGMCKQIGMDRVFRDSLCFHHELLNHYFRYTNSSVSVDQRLAGYHYLRQHRVILEDVKFLDEMVELVKKGQWGVVFDHAVVTELILEGFLTRVEEEMIPVIQKKWPAAYVLKIQETMDLYRLKIKKLDEALSFSNK